MVKIFFSYSHRDEEYRKDLEIHLATLKRQGIVETWHDRRIGAGEDVHSVISEHIEEADIVLLLVSHFFSPQTTATMSSWRGPLNGMAKERPA